LRQLLIHQLEIMLIRINAKIDFYGLITPTKIKRD